MTETDDGAAPSHEQPKSTTELPKAKPLRVEHVEVLPTEGTPQDYAAKLETLSTSLLFENTEAGHRGAVTFYGVALLYSLVLPRQGGWLEVLRTVMWIAGAVCLVLLENMALSAVAFGSIWPKCLYDDDCNLGRVCVLIRDARQGVCHACPTTLESASNRTLGPFIESIMKPILLSDAHQMGDDESDYTFTAARTKDRWPTAADAEEYCHNQLVDTGVAAWLYRNHGHSPGEAPPVCLHVLEAMHRFGTLDAIVLIVACLLVCASISTDRQQQLYVRHLRRSLLPPPWRSLRALSFLLVEFLCGALLVNIAFAMILLVFAGSLTSVDVLLNGVAISFVLIIDDELPGALVSKTDKAAIDTFAESVGDRLTMNTLRKQGLAHAGVMLLALFAMFAIGATSSCDDIAYECLAIALASPICAHMAEEMVAQGRATLRWRVKELAVALVGALCTAACVALVSRMSLGFYMLDGPDMGYSTWGY